MLHKEIESPRDPPHSVLMAEADAPPASPILEIPPMAKADRFGVVASILCAIHCALCAFVPLLFGALGLGFLVGHRAEWGFTIAAMLFAGVALWRAFSLGHKRVALLLAMGVLGLLASRALETFSHDEHHGQGEHQAQELHHEASPGEDPHQKSEHEGSSDKVPVGAWVGVFAAFMLTSGHTLNIRRAQKS